MKKICSLAFLIIFLVNSYSVNAQNTVKFPRVKIGDQIPDVYLEMINYPKAKAKISDFRGKLLILDFWSTWCKTCIQGFPKVRMLQRKFERDVMLLPVTSFGTKEDNEEFFRKRRQRGINDSLPSAVNATSLCEMFLISGLPTEVWIDKNGKVLAITDAFSLNEYFIQKVLNGEKVSFSNSAQNQVYNFTKPMLVNNNGANDSLFTYRSIITNYIEGFRMQVFTEGTSIDSGRSLKFTRNGTPFTLIYDVFSLINRTKLPVEVFSKNRVINESSKMLTWFQPRSSNEEISNIENWRKANYYNFELILPSDRFNIDDLRECALQDLCRYFKLQLTHAKRKTSCLVLSTTDKINEFKAKGEIQKMEDGFPPLTQFENYSISEINTWLNSKASLASLPPIINESTYQGKLDISIAWKSRSPESIETLKTELGKYGIELREEVREIDVLIFNDKPGIGTNI